MSLAPAVLNWLQRVTRHTATPVPAADLEAAFARPLESLSCLAQISSSLRQATRSALERLRSGRWQPRWVVAHNDLWVGNILVQPSAWSSLFICGYWQLAIIDWTGAMERGYGVYDLVRLALSLGYGGRRFRRELGRHCSALGCELIDAQSYLAVSLANLSMHLNHFPLERFLATAESCLEFLQSNTGLGRRPLG